MRITMIGTGYVGLVSGTCFSEFGFNVECIDVDSEKISKLNQLEIPIFEPGLEDMIKRNFQEGRLTFSHDMEKSVKESDVVFIAVGTPSRRGDGEADLTFVFDAAKQISKYLNQGSVVVLKSTVVVGTCRKVKEIIRKERPELDFSIVSNPEFLREGSAIEDFMRPDRVLAGVEDERGEEVVNRLYSPLNLRGTRIFFTSFENAEISKYASNAFLAMKITFINEIANLCERVGGDIQAVASAIGLDNRIGAKYLHAGPGYGGSCFPKDTNSLASTGRNLNIPQNLVETTIKVNDARKVEMADRILKVLGKNAEGKTVGILGIAFKPNTDDVRDAPSLEILPRLQKAGVKLKVHDPEARILAEKELPKMEWKDEPYGVADGADAVVVLTEWNVYRGLDLDKLAKLMTGNEIIDLRNIYSPEQVLGAGLNYTSIGKPPVMTRDDKL